MEPISDLVRSAIPNYLSNLPIPRSFRGWFSLSVKEWASLVPFFAVVGGISYTTYRAIKPKAAVNPFIKKEVDKVVDIVNIEDLGDKTSFCRCWRSSKFPFCDGSHNLHNKIACDNVGPIVLNRKLK